MGCSGTLMMEASVANDPLADRVARLERTTRRLATALAVLMSVGLVIFLARAGEGEVESIEAREFIVKDAHGRKRAVLGCLLFQPSLSLMDSQGNKRASLSVQAGEPSLRLVGDPGNGDMIMTVSKEKGTGIVLRGPDGREIDVVSGPDSRCTLMIKNNEGRLVGVVNPNGLASFEIASKGRPAFRIP